MAQISEPGAFFEKKYEKSLEFGKIWNILEIVGNLLSSYLYNKAKSGKTLCWSSAEKRGVGLMPMDGSG